MNHEYCGVRYEQFRFVCSRPKDHEGPHFNSANWTKLEPPIPEPVILPDMTTTDEQLMAYLHEIEADIDKALAESDAANQRARHLLDTGNEIIAELRRRIEASFLKEASHD